MEFVTRRDPPALAELVELVEELVLVAIEVAVLVAVEVEFVRVTVTVVCDVVVVVLELLLLCKGAGGRTGTWGPAADPAAPNA